MTPPPSAVILTSSPEGPIIAYDASSGVTVAHFAGSRSPPKGLTVAGQALIAASHISSAAATGSIHLYNWWSSTPIHQLPLPEPVAPITSTSDGLYLFSGGLSGCIYTLSLPSGDIIRTVNAHNKPISCLEISPDGSLLISGCEEGIVIVSPILQLNDNNIILHKFVGHSSSVTAVSCGMMNSTIISSSLDYTCKLWSLLDGTLLSSVTFPCAVLGVAIDPLLGSKFYAGGTDGSVYNFELMNPNGQLVRWNYKHGGAVVAVVVEEEGKMVVTASEDGSVWIWEVERGEVIRSFNQAMISISDLVVAKGVGKSGRCGSGGGCGSSLGFAEKELSMPVKEVMEMEEELSMVVEGRRRAIDTLEAAIEIYETLLGLILKEAKRGSGSKCIDEDKGKA